MNKKKKQTKPDNNNMQSQLFLKSQHHLLNIGKEARLNSLCLSTPACS